MSFDVEGAYVWDFWTVYDESTALHHLFFLHAPASLNDPDLRHRHSSIGHAVSADLTRWTRLADPLPDRAEFDDLAQWTGCVLRAPDGWWLFTTGLSRVDDGRVQRIGAARSTDLIEWRRTDLALRAAPSWYQALGPDWPDESWRDPWVVQDADGCWHLYATARAAEGGPGAGVVGHAVSADLLTWEVGPPLSAPTGRFEWMEVISVVQVEGRWVMVFSCLSAEMPGAAAGTGGVWSVPVAGPGAPVDVGGAVRLCDERLYVGRIAFHAGQAYLLAFRNTDPEGRFVGGVIDPVRVDWRGDGRGLALVPGDDVPVV